jgi:two-component system sensor histidine kinase ArlS
VKIKHKITLLFTLLVTAILLLLSVFVYYFTKLERNAVFKTRLESRAMNNGQIFAYYRDSSASILRRIDGSSLAFMPQKSVGIYDYSGKPLYQFNATNADSLIVDPAILEEAREKNVVFFGLGKRDAIAMRHEDPGHHFIVVIAAFDEDGWLRLSRQGKILVFSMIIGVFVTFVTGLVFSRQLVKPIIRIIEEVKEISSQNFSHRIETGGNSQDELTRLAATFNELLDRLEESFNIQRRFISNASHELSTPLTSISSQLQVTLQNERTTAEYKEVLQSIQEDVEQMGQLTKSLLEIAKTGTEGGIDLVDVRIDEVLLKVTGDVKKLNNVYRVELNFGEIPEDEKSCLVFGNSDLLYSALKNIIENGCKYSTDHISVVDVLFKHDNIIVEVKNKGNMIERAEVERIFQPFYRSAKDIRIKGFGLGLALAKRIVSLHKGSIEVKTETGEGNAFVITLPSSKKQY